MNRLKKIHFAQEKHTSLIINKIKRLFNIGRYGLGNRTCGRGLVILFPGKSYSYPPKSESRREARFFVLILPQAFSQDKAWKTLPFQRRQAERLSPAKIRCPQKRPTLPSNVAERRQIVFVLASIAPKTNKKHCASKHYSVYLPVIYL